MSGIVFSNRVYFYITFSMPVMIKFLGFGTWHPYSKILKDKKQLKTQQNTNLNKVSSDVSTSNI